MTDLVIRRAALPPALSGRIDATAPEGVDTTHWPAGWSEPLADYWVPLDHRPWYRRDAPGSEWEQRLLDFWDSQADPRSIDVAWKEDSGAPRAERLDRFNPDHHPLLRHLAALRLGYNEWAAGVNRKAHEQRVATWSCQYCGDWHFKPERHTIVGIHPNVRMCPQCRTVAAALMAERIGADVLADGRTRRETIAAILGGAT